MHVCIYVQFQEVRTKAVFKWRTLWLDVSLVVDSDQQQEARG